MLCRLSTCVVNYLLLQTDDAAYANRSRRDLGHAVAGVGEQCRDDRQVRCERSVPQESRYGAVHVHERGEHDTFAGYPCDQLACQPGERITVQPNVFGAFVGYRPAGDGIAVTVPELDAE